MGWFFIGGEGSDKEREKVCARGKGITGHLDKNAYAVGSLMLHAMHIYSLWILTKSVTDCSPPSLPLSLYLSFTKNYRFILFVKHVFSFHPLLLSNPIIIRFFPNWMCLFFATAFSRQGNLFFFRQLCIINKLINIF